MFYAPPKIPPLEYNGIRYQQDRETEFVGREFAATYLAAVDVKTGELLWLVKICDGMKWSSPKEIATVDFKKLAIVPGEDELTIETVPGFRFLVGLQNRSVPLVYDPDQVIEQRGVGPVDETKPQMPPTRPRVKKTVTIK